MTTSDFNRLHANRALLTRLFNRIIVSDTLFYKGTPCWEWQNGLDAGYGKAYAFDRSWPAHRLLYFLFVKIVPNGIHCDHLCRIKHCVNPIHIEDVTNAENQRRSPVAMATINRNKTHCIKGHPLSGDNLKITSKGNRACRQCIKNLTTYHNRRRNALPQDHPKKIRAKELAKSNHLKHRDAQNARRRERYRLRLGQFANRP